RDRRTRRRPGGASRRSRPMSRIRRILHPTDFSRASGAAFAKAVDLAKTNKAELLVGHVLGPTVPMVGDGYVSPQVYEDLASSARNYGKTSTHSWRRRRRRGCAPRAPCS